MTLSISETITALPIQSMLHIIFDTPEQLVFPGFKAQKILIGHKGYYEFDELGEEAQEKALEDLKQDHPMEDTEWWDCVEEDLRQNLEKIGFELDKAYFSGFSSQGDGASFTGGVTDAKKFLKAVLDDKQKGLLKILKAVRNEDYQNYIDNFACTVKVAGHYSHSGTMNVYCEYATDNDDYEYPKELQVESEVTEYLRGMADDFYEALEKEYNSMYEDEWLKEWIDGNEIHFDEAGNII